jgi:hypothetical protein
LGTARTGISSDCTGSNIVMALRVMIIALQTLKTLKDRPLRVARLSAM